MPGASAAAARGPGPAPTAVPPALLRPSRSVPCAVAHPAPPFDTPPAQNLLPPGHQQPGGPGSANLEQTQQAKEAGAHRLPRSPPQPRRRLRAGAVGPAGLPPSPLTSPGEPPASHNRKPQVQPKQRPEQHVEQQLRTPEACRTGDAMCGGWLHPYGHDPGGSANPHLTHSSIPASTPQREAPRVETPMRPPTTNPAVVPNSAASSSACNASLSVFASASGMAAAATVLAGMASTPPTALGHKPGNAGGGAAMGQQAGWQQLGCCIHEEATMGWLEDAQPARSGSKGGSSGGWGAGPGAGAAGSLQVKQQEEQQAAKLGHKRRDERQNRQGVVNRGTGGELQQHLLEHVSRWDDRGSSSSSGSSGSSANSCDPWGCLQMPKASSVPSHQTAGVYTTAAGAGSACGRGPAAKGSSSRGMGQGPPPSVNRAGLGTADDAAVGDPINAADTEGRVAAVAHADASSSGHVDGANGSGPPVSSVSLPGTAAGRWLSRGTSALRSALSRGASASHGTRGGSGSVGVDVHGEGQGFQDVSGRRLSGRALWGGIATSEAGSSCGDGVVRGVGPRGLAPCRPGRGAGCEEQEREVSEEERDCVTPSSMGKRLDK